MPSFSWAERLSMTLPLPFPSASSWALIHRYSSQVRSCSTGITRKNQHLQRFNPPLRLRRFLTEACSSLQLGAMEKKSFSANPAPIDLSAWAQFQKGLSLLMDMPLSLYDSGGNLLFPSIQDPCVCATIASSRRGGP